MKNQDKGKYGEDKACKYLQNKGYKILKNNYRFGKYEIDIICIKNKILTFVEVKYRTNIDLFTIKNQQYMNFYNVITSKFANYSISLDIILIYKNEIHHFENIYNNE